MGIFDRFRSSLEDIPDEVETEFPSLVLLVDDELPASTRFLQGAIEEVFGVTLDIDEPDSTEFITGEFPIFHCQMDGRLIMLKFIPDSYFSKKSAPFTSGNPTYVRARIQSRGLKCVAKDHVMWVEVCLVRSNPAISEAEAYEVVGLAMSAFSDLAGLAIIWPRRSEIRLWDDSMQETLKGGKPLDLFIN